MGLEVGHSVATKIVINPKHSPELFLPVSLIVFGIYFLRREYKLFRFSNSRDKFYRTKSSSRFLGVCSGLAKYLNTDSNLIRMIWIVFTFISMGLGIVVYFLIVVMVPYYNEDEHKQ